jgi:hypothetical protein
MRCRSAGRRASRTTNSAIRLQASCPSGSMPDGDSTNIWSREHTSSTAPDIPTLQADCGTGTCPATDILFGGQFHYHLFPDRLVDPWFGIGAGYEILNFTTEGGGNQDFSFGGFDFFNVQAGADFKITRNLGIGPFVVFTSGQFSSFSSSNGSEPNAPAALHEWLTFGIRFAYDIAIPSPAAMPPAPRAPQAHSPSDDWAAPGDRPPPFP